MNPAPARRWPILPTILVALACLTMIALGLWQWQRLGEKNALVALYQRNAAISSDVSFPLMPPKNPPMPHKSLLILQELL